MRKPTSMKTILGSKPATVKKAKKKAAKKAPPANMAMPMNMPKRVTIEQAGNGYVLSDHNKGTSMIAKSHTGMTKHLKGMMEE